MAQAGRGTGRAASHGRCARERARFGVRGTRLRPVLIGATAALLTHLAHPAGAQQYGRWSWDAGLQAETRESANEVGDEEVAASVQRDLRLGLAVNGFIVHPAVARFRLSGDFGLAGVSATRSRRNRRFGFGADLDLLPRGARALRLYARRQLHSQSELDADDPLRFLGVRESDTTFGGRLRLRRGLLQGSLAGYDRTSVSFEGPARGLTGTERAFWQWDRPSRKFQHHFRAEHRRDDFDGSDYSTRTLTLNYDQRGQLSPAWRWDSYNVGIRRQLDFEGASSGFDSLRSSQVFTRPFEDDSLDLRYDAGFGGSEGSSSQTHAVQARYWWRSGSTWTLAPFVGYRMQLGDATTLRSPQVGLAAHWSGAAGPVGLTSNNSLAYVLLDRSGSGGSGTDSTLALDVLFSGRHGDAGGLNEELELTWARSRLRVAGELLPELPDLGVPGSGIGTEDVFRGRLTLRWRWRGFFFFGWSEAERRVPSAIFTPQSARIDRLTHTLQVSGGRLTLTANLGSIQVSGPRPQNVDSRSAALTWRPLRLLSLGGSYRATDRRLALAPDIDIQRIEARADVWVGAFLLRGQWFQSNQAGLGGLEQTNRGFTVTLSRRFAGWLPFVTAPPPGGVIR